MTGCERILARLERGPATARELYAETYCIVHSRVAELRKQGYTITCEHVDGNDAGSYIYTLVSGDKISPLPESPGVAAEDAPSFSAAQLSLETAA